MPKITPFLWFDTQAEQAANYYASIFPNSKVTNVSRYPDGRAMVAVFDIDGQQVMAINGGTHYTLTEAFSFMIDCKDQAEVDHYWNKLIADGGEESRCGWLKDKFGLSWQVIPSKLSELMGSSNRAAAGRAMEAMMQMRKIDIAALQRAYDGK